MSRSTRPFLPLPLIVGSAAFIQAFDTSAIAVALPSIAADFQQPVLSLNVAITAYLLGATAFVPLSGWAADRFGARRAFIGGMIGFGIASFACAVATSLPILIALRVLQGCAGALLLPIGRIIVFRTEPRHRLVRAVALLTLPVMLGPLLGPLISGVIVQWVSWRWLFVLTGTVSLVGLFLILRRVEDLPARNYAPLDIVGLLLAGGGLSCLSYGMVFVARDGASLAGGAMLLVTGCLCTGSYIRHARRHSHPIVSLTVLKIPTARLSTIGGLFSRQLVSATPFLLALLFQIGFALSPLETGALIFAGATGSLLGRSLLGTCLTYVDFRTLLIANTFAMAGLTAACALLTETTPYVLISLLLFLQGASRSLQNIALMTVSLLDVPDREVGAVSTLGSMSQYFAFGMGIAVTVMSIEILGTATGNTALHVTTLRQVFVILGILSLGGLIWVLRLPPGLLTLPAPHR